VATWHEEEWKSGDALIDSEHLKLHETIRSMTAVIGNDPGLGLAAEAVDVLIERLRIHFRMEENLAAPRVRPEALARLKEDHQRLLRLLPAVGAALQAGDCERARRLMGDFHTQLDTHDREVDIPMFRRRPPSGCDN
jgi:hemerythrin